MNLEHETRFASQLRNLVVSSIRGSSQPMYVTATRIEIMLRHSLLTNGLGMNARGQSYLDKIDFRVALAPEFFPRPWPNIDALESSLAEYRSLM